MTSTLATISKSHPETGTLTTPLPAKKELLRLPITPTGSVDYVIKLMSETLRLTDAVRLFTFVNPFSCWLAKQQPHYKQLLAQFDCVFCDGHGMVLAAKLLGLGNLVRLSFDSTSLAEPVLQFCSRHNLGIFLIGGVEGVARSAAAILQSRFPHLRVMGVHSGYFSDPHLPIKLIINSGARVVICGMGAPKQEEFLLALKAAGWNGVGFTCGGYMDQLRGGFQYYPRWVDRANLRFAYRLFKEPRRLWRRYLVHYRVFGWLLAKGTLSRARALLGRR